MIRLHQYPPMFGIPNPSPFCMKLETWLRMANLPFEIVQVVDPRKGPKGKVPWIEDEGKTIADSAFIIEYLQKAYGDPLHDGELDPAQRATSMRTRTGRRGRPRSTSGRSGRSGSGLMARASPQNGSIERGDDGLS